MVRSRNIRRILERKNPRFQPGGGLDYAVFEFGFWWIALGLASVYWAITALVEGRPELWWWAGGCALGSALCGTLRHLI